MGCYATPETLKFYLLEELFFLSRNHETATKSLKRGILEECLLSFLASNRIISGIMYCPSGAVHPVGIYFWIMTSGQYIIPYLMYITHTHTHLMYITHTVHFRGGLFFIRFTSVSFKSVC